MPNYNSSAKIAADWAALPQKKQAKVIRRLYADARYDPVTKCMLSSRNLNRKGYSTMGFCGRVIQRHMLRKVVAIGAYDPALQINHLCGRPNCIENDHLEIVTPRDHVLKTPGSGPNAMRARTHCPQGHPYSLENTKMEGGSRRCKICKAKKEARRLKERERELQQAIDAAHALAFGTEGWKPQTQEAPQRRGRALRVPKRLALHLAIKEAYAQGM